MKIVSKFRDYYDSMVRHGQDLTTVFVRKPEPITNEPLLKILEKVNHYGARAPETLTVKEEGHDYRYTFGLGHLLVCGKIYRYVAVGRESALRWYTDYGGSAHDYFYDMATLTKFVESLGFVVKDIYRSKYFESNQSINLLEAFLSHQGTTEAESEAVKARVVTATRAWQCDSRFFYWEANDSLSSFKFYKLMDPYTVYQELDMYISGVLGQQARDVVNISDKDRIYQHGFDEYSFRKLPEERRKK
jgi:hypothetical protein